MALWKITVEVLVADHAERGDQDPRQAYEWVLGQIGAAPFKVRKMELVEKVVDAPPRVA